MIKKTKIVATIGPSSDSYKIMCKLIDKGLDVMRLNFSHGSHEEHKARIVSMRKAAREKNKHIAILLDTKGPEVRTMLLEDSKEVALRAEDTLILTTDENHIGNYEKVAVTYKNLVNDVKQRDTILLDDGLIALEVLNVVDDEVHCLIKNSGFLGENKGINLPNIKVNLPALSKKDLEDIKFGCEMDVDYIAASFVRKASDVKELRKELKKNGKKNIQIISKIENNEGISNFKSILELSDGIMVARGDLGVEIPIEEVPFAQKKMIQKCNEKGKFVITATQMLDSMMQNPRPTRAEAGDIVNAIMDGTDAVMLSGETAKGKYPVEALKTMAKICKRTDYPDFEACPLKHLSISEVIASGTVRTANDIGASAIVILAESGKTAINIKKLKPLAVIIVITTSEKVATQLALARGVYTSVVDEIVDVKDFQVKAVQIVSKFSFIYNKDIVLLTSGTNSAKGMTNLMKIEKISK